MIKLSSLIYIYIPNFGWMRTPFECLAKRKNWILGELLLISTRSSYHFTWAWIKWYYWNIIWNLEKFDKFFKIFKRKSTSTNHCTKASNQTRVHSRILWYLYVGIYIHNSILTKQVGSWRKHQFNHVLDIPQLSWCCQLCSLIRFWKHWRDMVLHLSGCRCLLIWYI